MRRSKIHLICNAHLDPVWQWRWEEGCAEALSTFANAVRMLHEHGRLIFNHNEALLYEWTLKHDPALFRNIQKLVKQGRWCIGGGWYLQPDVNLPGTESLIRHIVLGRQFFQKYFNAAPVVAYNFDSFGHSGGLPQILSLTGYKMYIHLRPQQPDLHIPSDLYRWKGVDGTEILAYRIAVGLYHTERDNIEERLREGVELALKLNRDVPVFWGIGNHGGGATREDLEKIDAFIAREKRVAVIHSTTENLYQSLRRHTRNAPVVAGDLQRVFTGCYTSLSRIKRRARQSLGELVQTEAIRTMSWLLSNQAYPAETLGDAWRDHLMNDFHDIITGSCTEPAEKDAHDLYGKVSDVTRRLRLAAATVINKGKYKPYYVPLTLFSAHPLPGQVPLEVECMLDLRPKWSGEWCMRLYDLGGKELPCQEEQPEALLPFNGWRRKIAFAAPLPSVGYDHFEVRISEGRKEPAACQPLLHHSFDADGGFITSLDAGDQRECLAGPFPVPLVVNDDGDAWGTDRWSYRDVAGKFEPDKEKTRVVHDGPVRQITEASLRFNKSSIVQRTIAYPHWPVIEFRLRITWNEIRKRLKLSFPTVFSSSSLLCEIPAGAIERPSDGQEYVHGRWCMLQGMTNERKTAFAVVNSGQHGIDCLNGEIRLSVLRSAAYCHEQGLLLGDVPSVKYMDQGVHDVRFIVTAGDRDRVVRYLPGLADWLAAPPVIYAHLPIGESGRSQGSLLSISPEGIRLLACKQSWDRKALIVRLQETMGVKTTAAVSLLNQMKTFRCTLSPFEIKTLRCDQNGRCREVQILTER